VEKNGGSRHRGRKIRGPAEDDVRDSGWGKSGRGGGRHTAEITNLILVKRSSFAGKQQWGCGGHENQNRGNSGAGKLRAEQEVNYTRRSR